MKHTVSIILLLLIASFGAYGATYYCTQAGDGDGTGSSLANAMSATAMKAKTNFAAGDSIYWCDTFTVVMGLKSGGTSANPIIVSGAYPGHPCIIDGEGTLTAGIYTSGGTTGDSLLHGVTFDDIEIKNIVRGSGIQLGVKTSWNDSSRHITIKNCYVHDIDTTYTNAAGISVTGNNITFTNNRIERCGGDGIYFTGSNILVDGNTIVNISRKNADHEDAEADSSWGDCIQKGESQISGVAASETNIIIRNNDLIHGNSYSKSCVMIQDATGVIVENNQIWGSKLGVDVVEVIARGPVQAIVRNNYFYGSSKSPLTIDGGAQVDAYNNIFDGGADKGTSDSAHILIASEQVDTVKIHHNTSYNSGKYGLVLSSTSALATLYHYNNIYHTCADKYLEIQSATPKFYSDYNCYYNSSGENQFRHSTSYSSFFLYKTAKLKDLHSYEGDPKFVSLGVSKDFHLQRSSKCIGTGTNTSIFSDYSGNRYTYPYDMGVYNYDHKANVERMFNNKPFNFK